MYGFISDAVAVLVGFAIVPGVADDAVDIGVGAGELDGVTWSGVGEGVLMEALAKGGTVSGDPADESIVGEVILEAEQIVLAKLIDAYDDDETWLGLLRGERKACG